MKTLFCMLLTFSPLLCLNGGVPDWPGLLNNAAHTGAYSGDLPLPVDSAWFHDLKCPVSGSPVAADGRIYVADTCGVLSCLSAVDGNLLWKNDLGEKITSTPLFSDGKIYLTTSAGNLYAVDAVTNLVVWTVTAGKGGLTAPTDCGNLIVAGAGTPDNAVMAFRKRDGMFLWRTQMGHPVTAAPSFAENTIACGVGNGTVAALNPLTGGVIWEKTFEGGLFTASSPSIVKGEARAMAGGLDRGFYKLNIESGARQGSILFPGREGPLSTRVPVYFSTPSGDGDVVCFMQCEKGEIGTRYTIKAMGDPDLKMLWEKSRIVSTEPDEPFAAPLVWKDKVIAALGQNILFVGDIKTGEVLWSVALDSRIVSPPALYDNKIIVVSASGRVYAFKGEGSAFLPENHDIALSSPGPINGSIILSYQLPEASKVRLSIINEKGQEVVTLLTTDREAGFHTYKWNGRGAYNRRLRNGIYFVQLKTDKFSKTLRLTLVEQ